LAQVEYAPSALEQQQVYIKKLRTEVAQVDDFLKNYQTKLNQERHDCEKYKESTVRRFAHKVVGKHEDFEAKTSKEEREYFDAVQEENKAKSQRDMLAQQLFAAEATHTHFKQETDRHSSLKAQLDALYNSIFAGATLGFPEEDAKEWAVNRAQRDTLTSNLRRAPCSRKPVEPCKRFSRTSKTLSTFPLLTCGSGSWIDIAERNRLTRAETGVANLEMVIQHAQQLDWSIQSIGPMQIASRHMMTDAIFDNIYSDKRMHDRIEASKRRLQNAAAKLDEELKRANRR
jgi:hypothetical protein